MSTPVNGINRILPGIAREIQPTSEKSVSSETKTEGSFTDLFSDLIKSVNDIHHESARIQEAFLNGEPVELHQVMIKAEEAGLATELLLEIRNRVVNAYNELLRMPI